MMLRILQNRYPAKVKQIFAVNPNWVTRRVIGISKSLMKVSYAPQSGWYVALSLCSLLTAFVAATVNCRKRCLNESSY